MEAYGKADSQWRSAMRTLITATLLTVLASASGNAELVNLPVGRTCQNATAQDIANAAQYLTGFAGRAGAMPPGDSNIQPAGDAVGQSAISTLGAALGIAPRNFLVRLCKDLKYIFFDKDNTNSDIGGVYAFWQKKQDAAHGAKPVRFIAIPLGVIQSPPIYTDYERQIIAKLVGHSYRVNITIQGAPDDQNTALFSMIAHEMGHILARRLLLKNQNTDVDVPTLCNTSSGSISFSDLTWLSPGAFAANPFHDFGVDIGATHRYDGTANNDPYIADIRNEVGANPQAADRHVYKVYHNGHYESLFASLAGDEDIAETYKYHVLWTAFPNLSVSLNFLNTGQTASIVRIAKKEKCVTDNEDTNENNN
jgi:hypothetical protein